MEVTQTLNLLTSEVGKILNLEKIDPDLGMAELGIDSLNIVELILACEQVYANRVDPERLTIDQYTSLRELDRQLLAGGAGSGEQLSAPG